MILLRKAASHSLPARQSIVLPGFARCLLQLLYRDATLDFIVLQHYAIPPFPNLMQIQGVSIRLLQLFDHSMGRS